MTIQEINFHVTNIKYLGKDDDNEAAHRYEDALREAFIEYIAAGGVDQLQEKAKLILTTKEMEFARWCA